MSQNDELRACSRCALAERQVDHEGKHDRGTPFAGDVRPMRLHDSSLQRDTKQASNDQPRATQASRDDFQILFFGGVLLHRKKTRVKSTNSGIRSAHDQAMYPKKLGIRMPDSSTTALTMKLGALPM